MPSQIQQNISNKIDLKGSTFSLSVLQLTDPNLETALSFLQTKIDKAPAFFQSAPVVINISKIAQDQLDFKNLYQGIRNLGMVPVGISGCENEESKSKAIKAGFALMRQGKSIPCEPNEEKSENQAPMVNPALIIDTPVRSGQQIYAQGRDLLILSHVSAGAEVISDGNIHILGSCRGRVLAGATGLESASIICHDLQAELVSIAGSYWLSDQIEDKFWQQKVMLTLTNQKLKLKQLNS